MDADSTPKDFRLGILFGGLAIREPRLAELRTHGFASPDFSGFAIIGGDIF